MNEQLTAYIASITGQRVETSDGSTERGAREDPFPFRAWVLATSSPATSRSSGTPASSSRISSHTSSAIEKATYKELQAQAIAYLALSSSDDPVLVQAARSERLHRDLRVLADGDLDRLSPSSWMSRACAKNWRRTSTRFGLRTLGLRAGRMDRDETDHGRAYEDDRAERSVRLRQPALPTSSTRRADGSDFSPYIAARLHASDRRRGGLQPRLRVGNPEVSISNPG